jgi:hypothetical protein
MSRRRRLDAALRAALRYVGSSTDGDLYVSRDGRAILTSIVRVPGPDETEGVDVIVRAHVIRRREVGP